jgi:hypothetical protein
MLRRFKVGSNTLIHWHHQLDLEVKLGKNTKHRTEDLSDYEKRGFINYYANEPTQEQTLRKYDITGATLDKWLKQLGIEKHAQIARSGFGGKAIFPKDKVKHVKKTIIEDPEPCMSIANRFRNVNGHNCTNLNPYR